MNEKYTFSGPSDMFKTLKSGRRADTSASGGQGQFAGKVFGMFKRHEFDFNAIVFKFDVFPHNGMFAFLCVRDFADPEASGVH